MPGLPFAHCCSLSTVKTFVRFASQIFFCYREKVIHFLTIELHLYNQHYDLVFKVTVFSTCLSWYKWQYFFEIRDQTVIIFIFSILKIKFYFKKLWITELSSFLCSPRRYHLWPYLVFLSIMGCVNVLTLWTRRLLFNCFQISLSSCFYSLKTAPINLGFSQSHRFPFHQPPNNTGDPRYPSPFMPPGANPPSAQFHQSSPASHFSQFKQSQLQSQMAARPRASNLSPQTMSATGGTFSFVLDPKNLNRGIWPPPTPPNFLFSSDGRRN